MSRDKNMEKLDKFIMNCLSQGIDEDKIKQELLACGWPEEYIENSFYFLKRKKEEENIKKILKIIDSLLTKLPDKAKEEFIYPKEFEFYKNILEKYKIK